MQCKMCLQPFEISKEDLDYYQKIEVPTPIFCPSCRMQRRTAFRNERNLYKRKCDFSGKEIISAHPPTSKFKVYETPIWWSDQWDPLKYGQNYDFEKLFFEQLYNLRLKIPIIALENRDNENSEYGNDNDHLKNCYLCFNGSGGQDCYYCNTFGNNTKDCSDLFWCIACELCYECTKVHESYHCFWCLNGKNLANCYFCIDCQSCKNCFGCIGLRQKEYCIYNKQLSKEKYEEFFKNFTFTQSNIEEAKRKSHTLSLTVPHCNLVIHQSENCVGDYINNSKNCTDCFDTIMSENCRYIWDGFTINNSYDCFNTGLNSNFLYECVACYTSNNAKFCQKCSMCSDITYSDYCFQSENLFGCVGLKHKKFCILNRQCTQKEYEDLVPRIIAHMKSTGEYGQFFLPKLNRFGYNDSLAMNYFPLQKEEALKISFLWNDFQNPKPTGNKTLPAENLPRHISEVTNEILETIIECQKDKKLFKIIPQELALYRRLGLPIPKLCPDCRHYSRKAQINPRHLWQHNCTKCKEPIKTTFAPTRPEVVYCEKCYLNTIY